MIITTMPLCPLLTRPFLSLTTVLGADLLSRCFDTPLCLAVNSLGQRCIDADLDTVPKYLQMLASIGIHSDPNLIFYDTDNAFFRFVESRVAQLMMSGNIRLENLEVVWCPCGVVEVPAPYVQTANLSQFHCIGKSQGALVCKKCEATLRATREDVWTFEFPATTNQTEVFGGNVIQFGSCLRGISGFRRIITRSHRKGIPMALCSKTMNLDVDFFWNMHLDYLVSIYATDIIVVLSTQTIQQFAQSISLMSENRSSHVQGIIHPIIKIQGDSSMANLTTEEFLKQREERSQVVRAFISQGFAWKQSPSHLLALDLYWARKSAYPSSDIYKASKKTLPLTSPSQFVKLLNRANVQTGLKKLRARHILDSQETKLLGAIIAPAYK